MPCGKGYGVDIINGQAIIVSHSPNVLPDDYKHIVRFYREDTAVRVVSGQSVQIDRQMEKHLLMNLPYIKEAFFSRCVIVVEGETEVGALPIWAEKVIGDPDDFGIVSVRQCWHVWRPIRSVFQSQKCSVDSILLVLC